MFLVISGTNRPGSNSLRTSRLVEEVIREEGREARVLDLLEMPLEVYSPESYATKPTSFASYQELIDGCQGIVTVIPEYNGSFPGALKYFVDMLRFPGSLDGLPSAFVGISAGMWGGLRAVEQMQMVFQYRFARLFPRRVFLPHIHKALDDEGRLLDSVLHDRLRQQARQFIAFAEALPRKEPSA